MMYRFWVIILLGYLLCPHAPGQVHTGAWMSDFVYLSPSARANGMAMTGVAMTDISASFFNPGSLGLCDDFDVGQYIFSPRSTRYEGSLKAYHRMATGIAAVRIGDWNQRSNSEKTSCLIGFGRTEIATHGWIRDLLYENCQAYAGFNLRSDISENITFAVGFRRSVDIGAGVTFKRIRQYSGDFKYEDTHCFDWGVLVRKRFVVNDALGGLGLSVVPAIGLSWSNYGPDADYWYYPIELPKTRRIGAAVELKLQDSPNGHSRMICILVPTFEVERRLRDEFTIYKVGGELGVFEAVYARAGLISYDRWLDAQPTWGFSVRSRGIARLLGFEPRDGGSESDGWLGHLLRDRIQIGLTFARVLNDDHWSYMDRADYWAVEISL